MGFQKVSGAKASVLSAEKARGNNVICAIGIVLKDNKSNAEILDTVNIDGKESKFSLDEYIHMIYRMVCDVKAQLEVRMNAAMLSEMMAGALMSMGEEDIDEYDI